MSALSGTAGSAVYMTGGTTVIGEITEWSLDMSSSPVDVTSFGDNWERVLPSIRGATGSISGNFDPADTAQASLINAFLGGSVVALRLYVSGSKYFNIGTAVPTGLSPAISQTGKADTAYNFKVSGPVTLV